MKKIIYIITIFFIGFSFYGCQKELDNWYSETSKYDGRYVIRLFDEDMNDVYVDYEDGGELQIYNTAGNIPNTVWLDDHEDVFPLKSKFIFTGESSSFKSKDDDFDKLENNIVVTDKLPTPAPTAAGESKIVAKEYIKATILEGKIIPKAATTIGGNKSDSLYLKIKLYSGAVTYESYEIPVVLRSDPEVPEFAWKFKSATHEPDDDEIYVIGGYRYTGYPEDAIH